MCEPVSIALGIASGVGGVMQAQAQHKAAKAAAARQNQINELNYRNNLMYKSVTELLLLLNKNLKKLELK